MWSVTGCEGVEVGRYGREERVRARGGGDKMLLVL